MCGVSFGAFLVFLLSIGWDPAELCEATKDVNVSDMCKPNVRHFFDHFGLASSDAMMAYLDNLTKAKDIDPVITFRDHMYLTDITLRIPALCLNTRKLVYFSHLSHPNLPVRDAIRASISIPLIYTSPIIDGQHFVDGGMIHNLPYDPYVGHEDKTLCLVIEHKNKTTDEISNMQLYIGALLDSFQTIACSIPPEFHNLIEIKTPYNGLSFSIKQEEIEEMILIGQKCVI